MRLPDKGMERPMQTMTKPLPRPNELKNARDSLSRELSRGVGIGNCDYVLQRIERLIDAKIAEATLNGEIGEKS